MDHQLSRPLLVLSVCALATGAALLAYFLTAVSLGLALAFTLAVALMAGVVAVRRLDAHGRRRALVRLRAGAAAGLFATACYDASRLLLVALADLSIRPFDTWRLFGELFLGPGAAPQATFAVGTAYHLANGVGFAVAYTLVLGTAGWRAGVAWALVLEALMVTFYPGWLDVGALDEFLSVSVLGHMVYGSVLGASARHLVRRRESAVVAGRP